MCIRQQSAPDAATTLGHRRVAAQRGDVVDERRARRRAPRRHRRLGGVDRDLRPQPASRRPSITGRTRAQLLGLGHRARRPAASTRRRRRGSPRRHARARAPWAIAARGVEVTAPVGERVRGHVDDPHHREVAGRRASVRRRGSSSGQRPCRRSTRAPAPPLRARGWCSTLSRNIQLTIHTISATIRSATPIADSSECALLYFD